MSIATLIKTITLSTLAALLFVFITTTDTNAGTANNIAGSAWSANIGWISLNNCTDPADSGTCTGTEYGVTALESAPGTLSGYAWSPNLGWITFSPENTCPTGFSQCAPYIDWANLNGDGSANIKGWARVCSYYQTGCSGQANEEEILGGWDGWIALGDTDAGSGPSWGVTVRPDGTFDGFAWGSDVLGWISFSGVRLVTGVTGTSVQVVANPKVVAAGNTSTLTITANNINEASSCTSSWGAPLTMTNTGGSAWSTTAVISPTLQTTYSVTCQGPNGSATGQDTVYILKVNYLNSQCVPAGNPNPTFSWNSENATANSCTLTRASGGLQSGLPTSATNYSSSLSVQSGSSIYTLQCVNGTQTAVSDPVTVSTCVPDFSLTATPSSQGFSDGQNEKKVAVFTVGATPYYGFTGTITLQGIPQTMMPPSRDISFTPQTITCNGTSCTQTQMTVTVDAVELTSTTSYPIRIEGTSGVVRSATVTIDANGRRRPLFREF